MKYIECPEVYDDIGTSIFLAGGITNCSNWQQEMVEQLSDSGLVVINPRRKSFNVSDPKESEFQVNWEYDHLGRADAILFWFPPETLCPITLYELGAHATTKEHLFIGVHPDYKRKIDVELQISLARPFIDIVYSIQELGQQVLRKMTV